MFKNCRGNFKIFWFGNPLSKQFLKTDAVHGMKFASKNLAFCPTKPENEVEGKKDSSGNKQKEK